MLNLGLSLLTFAIVVVGECWWMDHRGAAASPPSRPGRKIRLR